MKKNWKSFPPFFPMLLLAVTALLSGCGASKNSASGSADDRISMIQYADSRSAPAAAMETAPANMEMDIGESGLESSSSITKPQSNGRKLIRNVRLSVETDAFDELLPTLQNRIAELSGYIEQSDISGSSMTHQNLPSRRSASITARIPSSNLDQFISDVEGCGNITYRSESTTDVTLQYSDLESRKKSLTIEQERIWALLEKADTLEAVIALEERLSEIRYELESMESQLRLYDNQVDYSTVWMDISEVTIYTPTNPVSVGERIQSGFAKNLERLGDFLTTGFILILSASPIWLPLLILAGLIFLLVRRYKRRGKRSKTVLEQKKESESRAESESNEKNGQMK